MQYYNQPSYSSFTGHQSELGSSNSGYQIRSDYPWYNQMAANQYSAVQQGLKHQQLHYQQPYMTSIPASYTRDMMAQFARYPNKIPTGNQAVCKEVVHSDGNHMAVQYGNQTSLMLSTPQNDQPMKEGQGSAGSRSNISSNPLSLNFYNLRQAMGNENDPAQEDRKKYGDRKPPYSYVAMIHMAMTNNLNKKCTLREILDYIEDRFPYYKQHSRKLHGAIRHNLTLNDCFVKAGRRLGDKGCLWTLDKEYVGMFESGSFLRRKCRLLEGRIDKYNRNKKSKKSRKHAAKTSSVDAQQETDCKSVEDSSNTSTSSTPNSSTCSISPGEKSSSLSITPVGTDSSPETACMSPFNLEQFADICAFPEFSSTNNRDADNDVTNVCRRLSTELAEEYEIPAEVSSRHEVDTATGNDYSPCAYSAKMGSSLQELSGNLLQEKEFTSLTGLDIQFPTFLEIPDIMHEVNMNEVQIGFSTDISQWC